MKASSTFACIGPTTSEISGNTADRKLNGVNWTIIRNKLEIGERSFIGVYLVEPVYRMKPRNTVKGKNDNPTLQLAL